MKRLISIIISVCIWSASYADDVHYELLTPRIIEKLQGFGMRTINYYSLVLHKTEIETIKVVESFKSNRDNCGDFISFWWYMWAPMSERGFIENAYMTPSEAYVCCEIGSAIYTNKERAKEEAAKARIRAEAEKELAQEKEESEMYSKWLDKGVPSWIKPNNMAQIQISVNENLVKYVSENRTNELFKTAIRIKICANGDVEVVSTNENDDRLLELFEIKVISPANYHFEHIDKSIPMESFETINVYEKREPVRTKLMSGQYEAAVKYSKSDSKWKVKITKYYIDEFIYDTGAKMQDYLDAVSNRIISSQMNPKKYIKFRIFNSKLYIEKQGTICDQLFLPPTAIIDDTQNTFYH